MDKIPQIQVSNVGVERIPPPILSPIERAPAPVVERVAPPIVDSISPPVVNIPNPRLDYPTLQLPPNPPVPKMGDDKSKEEPKTEKSRSLPTPTPLTPPPLPPSITAPQAPAPAAPPPKVEETIPLTIAGHEIVVPSPKTIVQASVTAVVGTSATLATALVFNQARRVLGDTVTKAARNKFKIKLRSVKPVLHFVLDSEGKVEVIEYTAEGVRPRASGLDKPEQYLRDLIEADELFEADHRIVIDEPVRDLFTKEGAKRFNYFAPSKKMAKRLSARLTFG